jgi:hypothetical protein
MSGESSKRTVRVVINFSKPRDVSVYRCRQNGIRLSNSELISQRGFAELGAFQEAHRCRVTEMREGMVLLVGRIYKKT